MVTDLSAIISVVAKNAYHTLAMAHIKDMANAYLHSYELDKSYLIIRSIFLYQIFCKRLVR